MATQKTDGRLGAQFCEKGLVVFTGDLPGAGVGLVGKQQEPPPHRRRCQLAIRKSYCRSGMQSNLLNSPVANLPDVQLILVTAINGIDRAEFRRRFSCPSELTYNLAR